MAFDRTFARSRAIRLVAALCAVSALAFVLGQGAAAVRSNLTIQRPTTPQPQILERVSGAQGVARPTATPTAASTQPTQAKPATFSLVANQTPKARPLAAQQPLNPKDKHHHSHTKAAGDSSHGGLSHQEGGKHSNQDKLSNQDKQGAQSSQTTQGAQNTQSAPATQTAQDAQTTLVKQDKHKGHD